MRASIGIYDAKTQLSRLIERVEGGERITITRNGVPVAELVPAASRAVSGDDAVAAFAAIRAAQDAVGRFRSDGETLRDAAHAGHDR